MSFNLPSTAIIATKGPAGWTPTEQMQGWWRAKTRSAPRPRALQPFAIADEDGKPTRYLMGLWRTVYGKTPFTQDLVIIRGGRGTAEFLLVANA